MEEQDAKVAHVVHRKAIFENSVGFLQCSNDFAGCHSFETAPSVLVLATLPAYLEEDLHLETAVQLCLTSQRDDLGSNTEEATVSNLDAEWQPRLQLASDVQAENRQLKSEVGQVNHHCNFECNMLHYAGCRKRFQKAKIETGNGLFWERRRWQRLNDSKSFVTRSSRACRQFAI